NQFEITYYDYSESGRMFFGGKVSYSGSFNKSTFRWIPGRFVFNSGGLVFAGSYSGKIIFDNFRLFFDEFGVLIDFITAPDRVICFLPAQGNLIVTASSGTLRFDPYYRSCDTLSTVSKKIVDSSPELFFPAIFLSAGNTSL
ncbi:MAG TPA: hypothetical protein VJ417_06420, partial [Candidatus Glassbacteria bacterium]|nr:hypothetical protein [Candidatus Glassbacteria bacterium]